jgi:hypothetical protein
MHLFNFLICLFVITITSYNIECWKEFEPDLFDLVEDVGKSFYEVFDVAKVNKFEEKKE